MKNENKSFTILIAITILILIGLIKFEKSYIDYELKQDNYPYMRSDTMHSEIKVDTSEYEIIPVQHVDAERIRLKTGD